MEGRINLDSPLKGLLYLRRRQLVLPFFLEGLTNLRDEFGVFVGVPLILPLIGTDSILDIAQLVDPCERTAAVAYVVDNTGKRLRSATFRVVRRDSENHGVGDIGRISDFVASHPEDNWKARIVESAIELLKGVTVVAGLCLPQKRRPKEGVVGIDTLLAEGYFFEKYLGIRIYESLLRLTFQIVAVPLPESKHADQSENQ